MTSGLYDANEAITCSARRCYANITNPRFHSETLINQVAFCGQVSTGVREAEPAGMERTHRVAVFRDDR